MEKIIFFGNGPLSEYALKVLEKHFDVIFHAKMRDDLEAVKKLKASHPEAHGILASFGVMIKADVLDLFEPEGILNIHPSLLPLYRGASPIESAILNGDTEFSVSVMKLVKEMDAGPVYYQTTLKNLPINKSAIYKALSEAGAQWISNNLTKLPKPTVQDEKKATFTAKLEKSMSKIDPKTETAEKIFRKIVALQGFPKVKYAFNGINCIILEAHILKTGETAPIMLECKDGALSIDRLQPESKKPMDARSFLNGYCK